MHRASSEVMAAGHPSPPRSALAQFVRKNWKWLVIVLVVAAFVMMVASD